MTEKVLEKIIVCPLCKGALKKNQCSVCKKKYVQKNKVTSFITREMYATDEEYGTALRIIDFWGNGWEKRLKEPDHRDLFKYNKKQLKEYAASNLQSHMESDSLFGRYLSMESLKNKVAVNIGCGAGGEALQIVNAGAVCVAMDITSQAAGAAQSIMYNSGGKGVGIQGDARFLPLADSSVDIVYSSGVLHHSPDLSRSISEIYRVLKPGGAAYIMLYATWSILFVQMRIKFSMGETAWETEGRTNPVTTTYTVRECKNLFKQFGDVSVTKTGGSLRHLAKIGKFLPTRFDKFLSPIVGPRLNIIAKKLV